MLYIAGFIHRNIHIWFFQYIAQLFSRKGNNNKIQHVLFCFVDHYEPLLGKASFEKGMASVKYWQNEYPTIAIKFTASDGCYPRHTFFYPEEEYHKEYLDVVSEFCQQDIGEIEIHLHHDNDTENGFKDKINSFKKILRESHGALPDYDGDAYFAFIHGNWALDNSRKDGKWCGLNNEITLLRDLNCYADFTLPSAPSDTQTKTINSIYYATDDPNKPKSHDKGELAEYGLTKKGDLMIIQGPLTLNWKNRSKGVWPRIESGDVTPSPVPIEQRVRLWVKAGVHVKGKPDWIIVKVHTHGADEINSEFLFKDNGFEKIWSTLDREYNDNVNYKLHYVSTRELYNIIKAIESGCDGEPGDYRNYHFQKPAFK